MKRTITTALMVCLITLTVSAQKAELLKDKWIYKDIADKEKLDSTILKQAKMLFAKTEMEFFPDGKYLYNPLGNNPNAFYKGTWTLNKEENKVTVLLTHPSTGDKKTSEWEIKGLTAKELQLNMGKAVIVFSRPKTEKDIRESEIKEQLKKHLKFSEGLAAIGINDNWGFVDSTGKEIINFKYTYAENFKEGLAKVRVGKYPAYKYGFIDKTGKEIIIIKYTNVGNFSEGLVPINIEDQHGYRWGYCDKTGKEIIPLKYGGTWDFREGLAMVRNGSYGIGKCGFIDKTGKEIIPLKYDEGDEGFKEGLALVVLDGKYGFIDKTGTEIIPLKYDFGFSFKEGLAVVNLNKKWGFINKTGKEITPLKYDNAQKGGFAEGLASVELNGKWGFIDKTGKEIIPLKYDYVSDFKGGKTKVKLNGREFYIDKTGKEVSK